MLQDSRWLNRDGLADFGFDPGRPVTRFGLNQIGFQDNPARWIECDIEFLFGVLFDERLIEHNFFIDTDPKPDTAARMRQQDTSPDLGEVPFCVELYL